METNFPRLANRIHVILKRAGEAARGYRDRIAGLDPRRREMLRSSLELVVEVVFLWILSGIIVVTANRFALGIPPAPMARIAGISSIALLSFMIAFSGRRFLRALNEARETDDDADDE